MATAADNPVLSPVLNDVLDDVAPVQGAIISGYSSNDTLPTIKGAGEPGTVVNVYDNGVLLGAATVALDWSWSLELTAPLAQGAHALTLVGARADGSGQTPGLPASFDFSVGVDQVPPVMAPMLFSVDDGVAPVQGVIPDGGSTNDTQPTLSGLAQAGTVVSILDNGVQIGTALVDADGNWSFKPDQSLTSGLNTFTLVAAHADGSGTSPGLHDYPINVGHDPVQIPTMTTAIDDVGTVQGPLANGELPTDDAQPALAGTGEVGTMVTVQADGTAMGTTLVDANGQWSFTPAEPLVEGSHVLSVTASLPDGSGNSQTSGDWRVQVDPNGTGTGAIDPTTMPPVISGIMDSTGPVTGVVVGSYGVVDDPQPTLMGSALPGTRLEVFDGGVKIGETATPANSWAWTFQPADPLAAGDHVLTVRTMPTDGSAPVDAPYAWTVTEGTAGHEMPSPVITDMVYGHYGQDIFGRVADEGAILADQFELVSGTAVPGTEVNVYDNGVLLGKTITDSDWSWRYYMTPVDGHHEISVTSHWLIDDQPGAAAPYTYTFDVNSGQESVRTPVIVGLGDDVGAVQGEISGYDTTDDNMPTLSGTAQAGLKLEVFDGSTLIGEAVVDDSWQWTFTPVTSLVDGVHDLVVRTSTLDGEASSVSMAHKLFFVDTSSTQAAPAALDTLLANAGLTAADTTTTASVNGNAVTPALVAQAAVFDAAVHHDLAY